MSIRKMTVHIPGLPVTEVVGDPDKFTVAGDGSGMLVYVRDVKTGSMIRVGRHFLRDVDSQS